MHQTCAFGFQRRSKADFKTTNFIPTAEVDLLVLASAGYISVLRQLIQGLSHVFQSGRTVAPGPVWEFGDWLCACKTTQERLLSASGIGR